MPLLVVTVYPALTSRPDRKASTVLTSNAVPSSTIKAVLGVGPKPQQKLGTMSAKTKLTRRRRSEDKYPGIQRINCPFDLGIVPIALALRNGVDFLGRPSGRNIYSMVWIIADRSPVSREICVQNEKLMPSGCGEFSIRDPIDANMFASCRQLRA